MPALIPDAPHLEVEVYLGGTAFTLDDPERSRLDAGNVLGPTEDGWHPLTPLCLAASWRYGATRPAGPRSRMAPAFAQVSVYDPARMYDPGNQAGPFRGRIQPPAQLRLTASTPPTEPAPWVDTFTGPDGDPLGPAWADLFGVWVLDAGQARPTGGGGLPPITLTDPGALAGNLVRCSVKVNATNGCGPVVGGGGSNVWSVRWIAASSWWRVDRLNASNTWTSTGWTVPGDGQLPVEVTADLDAGTITVAQEGVTLGTYDTAGRLDGRLVGMTSGANPTTPRFDDFTVWPTVPGTPGETWPTFTGKALKVGWSEGVTTIEASCGLADLAAYDAPGGPEVGAGETSGQRIARILTDAGYRGPATLDAGTQTVQASALAQTALTNALLASDSELGLLWVDPHGRLLFRDRTAWTTRRGALDGVGPADLAGVLTTTRSEASADEVANIIDAAAEGLEVETAADLDSIARWGQRRWGRRDLILQTAAQLQAWAAELLVWSREIRPGAVEQLVLWPQGAPRLWPLVMRLEPTQPLRLDLEGREEQPLVVGWAHSVTPRDWRVTVVLAPHPLDAIEGAAPFTLDDPARAQLDAGNVLT